MNARVVLVPGVLALLPEYAGLVDPVAELRAACVDAVSWLGEGVVIVADTQGARVAAGLLAATGHFGAIAPEGQVLASGIRHFGAIAPERQTADATYLVVANGSARRSEKAPGHLDERALEFDEAVGSALRAPDPAELARVDASLGDELLAGNVAGLHALGELLTREHHTVSVDYDDDPFGVQYWVMRWSCES